jgi:hypothetical protein
MLSHLRKIGLLLISTLFGAISVSAGGHGDPGCEPFLEETLSQTGLQTEYRNLGSEFLTLSPGSPYLQHKKIQLLVQNISMNASIPKQCRAKILDQLGLSSAVSIGFNFQGSFRPSGPEPTTSQAVIGKNISLFRLAVRAFDSEITSVCAPVNSAACLRRRGEQDLEKFQTFYSTHSQSERENIYRSTAEYWRPERLLQDHEARAIDVFLHVTTAPSYEESRVRLRGFSSLLTEQEKIAYLSISGDAKLFTYDDQRSENKEEAGIVQPREIFAAVRSNIGRKALSHPVLLQQAGVCRDIAIAQMGEAEDLGLPRSVMISYATNEFWHTTIAVESKDDQGNSLYLISYDSSLLRKNTDGSLALFQTESSAANLADNSLVYRLYDKKGNPLGRVSSGRGKFLLEAAGVMSPKTFDPRATPRNDLITTSIYYGKNRQGSAHLFAGQDEQGSLYAGAAATYQWGSTTPSGEVQARETWSQNGKVGILIGSQLEPHHIEEYTPARIDLFTVQLTQNFYTPTIELKDFSNLAIQGEVGFDLIGAGFVDRGEKVYKLQFVNSRGEILKEIETKTTGYHDFGGDGDIQFRAGVNAQADLPFDKSSLLAKIQGRFVPDTKDARETPLDITNLRVVPQALDASLTFRQPLESGADPLMGHLRFEATWDRMGSRGEVGIGATSNRWSVESGWSGRMTSAPGIPGLIQDGSLQRIHQGVQFKFSDFNLGYQLRWHPRTYPEGMINFSGVH